MKNLTKIFILIAVVIEMSSCSPKYYAPNVQNVPLLKEKGDMQFLAAKGDGEQMESIEAHGSIAVTNHLGIIAGYGDFKGYDEDSEEKMADAETYELGAGYYNRLGRAGVFEAYGGLALINQHHDYGDGINKEIKAIRPFVQPAIGINTDWFEAALSTRLAFVDYNKIADVDGLDDKFWVFVEPALTIRAGYKNFKLQVQYVYSELLNPFSDDEYDWWIKENFSIGISVDFCKRFSQKKQDRKF